MDKLSNQLVSIIVITKGIVNSNAEFILCLNDDVILDNKFTEEALRGFFVDTRVDIVSGRFQCLYLG